MKTAMNPPDEIYITGQGGVYFAVSFEEPWETGSMHNVLSLSNAYQEQTRMIKVIEANYKGNFEIALAFSDSSEGIFDGKVLLKHQGPLLDGRRVSAGRAQPDCAGHTAGAGTSGRHPLAPCRGLAAGGR
jgi:hypothetical protein